MQRPVLHTSAFSPLSHSEGEPPISHEPAAAPIACLLLAGDPSTVVGRVPHGVVEPVQRGPRRCLPHVVKERLKRARPLGAHANAPPAVVCEVFRVRVGTPLDHASPHVVLVGAPAAMSRGVRKPTLPLEAPAGVHVDTEVKPCGNLHPATITYGVPIGFFRASECEYEVTTSRPNRLPVRSFLIILSSRGNYEPKPNFGHR